jgi:hypothetical protein
MHRPDSIVATSINSTLTSSQLTRTIDGNGAVTLVQDQYRHNNITVLVEPPSHRTLVVPVVLAFLFPLGPHAPYAGPLSPNLKARTQSFIKKFRLRPLPCLSISTRLPPGAAAVPLRKPRHARTLPIRTRFPGAWLRGSLRLGLSPDSGLNIRDGGCGISRPCLISTFPLSFHLAILLFLATRMGG